MNNKLNKNIAQIIHKLYIRSLRKIRIGLIVLIFLIVIIGHTLSIITHGTKIEYYKFKINDEGVVIAVFSVDGKKGLNTIEIPSSIIPSTVRIYIDDLIIPSIIVENKIHFYLDKSSTVTITYLVNITISNGIGSFKIEIPKNQKGTIVISSNVILLSLPENILDTRIDENRNLIIVFSGVYRVRYTLRGELPPIDIDRKDISIVDKAIGLFYSNLNIIIPIILLSIISSIYLYKKYRRRKVIDKMFKDFEKSLDETDILILNTLRQHNGVMFQGDLLKITGIPKTTLWRHINRLEKNGYINIKYVGKKRMVFLRKEFKKFNI